MGFLLPSLAPSLRSSLGLAAEARVDVTWEVLGLRRKTKWQSGKGGSACCSGTIIKHEPPTLRIQGFVGNRSMICASPNSPQQCGGPSPGLSRNYSMYRPFIAAICYCSSNIRRLLRHLLCLSNYYYCTAITPVFSPRFVFSKISTCGSGTVSSI